MLMYLFTSESVSEGHPDKIADQISDAILDAYLREDPDAKVACECLITNNYLLIAGEVSSIANSVDPVSIAKDVIKAIGYDNPSIGFDYQTARIENRIHQQSPEINQSVSDGGAGDQGLMFGYACRETAELMPLPISLSHSIVKRLSLLRKNNSIGWLLPDAKSQVTILYENGKPASIDTVVVSTQHRKSVTQDEIRETVIQKVILPVIGQYFEGKEPVFHINPSGSFTIGGPYGDTGLTGRKIIVDTYGGSCPHGGGAFSGKDPSKVDRSGAYGARYVAKHIVASGLAERCTVQISYAIGKAEPVSLFIDFHNTGKIDEEKLLPLLSSHFDLTPNGIISTLKLKQPIYLQTAAYGHFGKTGLPWEELNPSIFQLMRSLI